MIEPRADLADHIANTLEQVKKAHENAPEQIIKVDFHVLLLPQRAPDGQYKLYVALGPKDNGGNTISFSVQILVGRKV